MKKPRLCLTIGGALAASLLLLSGCMMNTPQAEVPSMVQTGPWSCHTGCDVADVDYLPGSALFDGKIQVEATSTAGQKRVLNLELHGATNGNSVQGTFVYPGGDHDSSGACTTPDANSTFTAQVLDNGKVLSMTLMVPTFRAEGTQGLLFSSCQSVTQSGSNPEMVILTRNN